MPKIDRSKIPFTNNASYPKEFAGVIAGREKQKLGDAVGLTQFGVNIARIKANSKSALRHWHESEDEFIYVLEGELVLHEDGTRSKDERVHYPDVDFRMERDDKGRRWMRKSGEPIKE